MNGSTSKKIRRAVYGDEYSSRAELRWRSVLDTAVPLTKTEAWQRRREYQKRKQRHRDHRTPQGVPMSRPRPRIQ